MYIQYIHTHVYIYMLIEAEHAMPLVADVCLILYGYICIYVCMHIYICVYTNIYIHI